MEIRFENVDGRFAVAYATRPDGASVRLAATSKGGLPHDLEHLIVEDALHLVDGFWPRVARGAEFRGMHVDTHGPRRRPRSTNRDVAKDYTGFGEQVVTDTVSFWRQITAGGWSPDDWLPMGWTKLATKLRGYPGATVLSESRLHDACAALSEAATRWGLLDTGESLCWTTKSF